MSFFLFLFGVSAGKFASPHRVLDFIFILFLLKFSFQSAVGCTQRNFPCQGAFVCRGLGALVSSEESGSAPTRFNWGNPRRLPQQRQSDIHSV